jgi:hypothetical protein
MPLSNGLTSGREAQMALPCYYTLDAVYTFPYILKGRIHGCYSETDIIRLTKIRDDIHVLYERQIDTISVRMANADM